MKEKAFNGKILNVFLNRGAAEKEELPEQMYRDYLGGYGLGARLLFDRVPAGADALGPDNILGLMPASPSISRLLSASSCRPATGTWKPESPAARSSSPSASRTSPARSTLMTGAKAVWPALRGGQYGEVCLAPQTLVGRSKRAPLLRRCAFAVPSGWVQPRSIAERRWGAASPSPGRTPTPVPCP